MNPSTENQTNEKKEMNKMSEMSEELKRAYDGMVAREAQLAAERAAGHDYESIDKKRDLVNEKEKEDPEEAARRKAFQIAQEEAFHNEGRDDPHVGVGDVFWLVVCHSRHSEICQVEVVEIHNAYSFSEDWKTVVCRVLRRGDALNGEMFPDPKFGRNGLSAKSHVLFNVRWGMTLERENSINEHWEMDFDTETEYHGRFVGYSTFVSTEFESVLRFEQDLEKKRGAFWGVVTMTPAVSSSNSAL